MAKEAYVQGIRDLLAQSQRSDWEIMQKALRLFEELCVPRDAMPDDEIMQTPKMENVSAMWAYVRSSAGQAETETTHHDYADAIAMSLIAAANVLTDYRPENEKVLVFKSLTHLTPQEFLDLSL